MTWIFKLFGAAIALFAAGVVSGRYAEHLTYRLELTRGFAELLSHIKNKITVSLAPPSELVRGFCSEVLSRCGFLSAAEEVGSPKDAYFSVEKTLPLPPEARRTLEGYFAVFGLSYKDELIRATEAAESALRSEVARLEGELPREKKLSRTVIFAAALGAIILLV